MSTQWHILYTNNDNAPQVYGTHFSSHDLARGMADGLKEKGYKDVRVEGVDVQAGYVIVNDSPLAAGVVCKCNEGTFCPMHGKRR